MPLGEALLDAGLPFDQPVHRCVELVLIDVAESKQFAQGGYRARGGQRAGGGQLRARVDDAGDDKSNDEVAEAVGAAGDDGCTPSCLRIPTTAATWRWGRYMAGEGGLRDSRVAHRRVVRQLVLVRWRLRFRCTDEHVDGESDRDEEQRCLCVPACAEHEAGRCQSDRYANSNHNRRKWRRSFVVPKVRLLSPCPVLRADLRSGLLRLRSRVGDHRFQLVKIVPEFGQPRPPARAWSAASCAAARSCSARMPSATA